MTLTTSLPLLRKAGACEGRYKHLRSALGPGYGDKPINLLTILELSGLDDALWALHATAENCDRIARLMAADFAEEVLPIYQRAYPGDDRPEKLIIAARAYANGTITAAAWAAARAAARAAAADAAWAATWAAAWAAAGAAAGAAAWSAAEDAARAAPRYAAGDAAGDAAGAAAWADAQQKQRDIFISYLQPEEATK